MAISAAKQAFLDALAGVKQKIDTGDDTFSETEMAAVTNLVNEKVAGITAGLTTQVAQFIRLCRWLKLIRKERPVLL